MEAACDGSPDVHGHFFGDFDCWVVLVRGFKCGVVRSLADSAEQEFPVYDHEHNRAVTRFLCRINEDFIPLADSRPCHGVVRDGNQVRCRRRSNKGLVEVNPT